VNFDNSDSDGGDDDGRGSTSSSVANKPGASREPRASTMQTFVRDDGTEVPAKLNNKVFIDGLPYEEPKTGASLLDQLTHFASEWKVGKVMHLSKKPGQGFGYLAFRSPHSVEVAVNVLNGRKFLGRPLRVQIPKPPREKPNTGYQRADATSTPYERQVLLSDLSKIAEPDVIREVIREFAPALEPRVETIKMTGGGRKAFVTLVDVADVEPFVTFMHGFRLLGRSVHAEAAKPPGALPFSKPTAPKAFTSPQATGGVAGPAGSGTRKVLDEDDDGGFEEDAPASGRGIGASAIDKAMGSLGFAAAPVAVAGSNASKKFPMPDLLNPTPAARKGAASAAAPAATKYDYADRGSKQIVVGNLPDDVTTADLKAHFASCGRVTGAEVIVNPHTREPMGLAKVTFAIAGQAKHAAERMNGSRLHGSALRIDREGDAGADDEDRLVVAGPSGIRPLDCTESTHEAPAAPGKAALVAAGGKTAKKRSVIVNDEPDNTFDEEEEEKAAEQIAHRYGVKKSEVRKIIQETKPSPKAENEPVRSAGKKLGRKQKDELSSVVMVRGADPSKKRLSTKELIEKATEKSKASKTSAAAKQQEAASAAPIAENVVSFDDGDNEVKVKKGGSKKGVVVKPTKVTAAASADDSDEEVFRDVDARPATKGKGKKGKRN
jgi:RNA recognition motif-containing protein